MTVDLTLLPAFVAVAELGSFSAAAQQLGVEKSSVSRRITRLEAVMATRLVHRTTRRVTLSAAGSALYEAVVGPMAALQAATTGAIDLDGSPTGRLRVTAPVDLGSLLSDSVDRFVQRHPRVQVELRLTSEVVDLVTQSFDVAVRVATRALRDSSLYVRSAGELRVGVYASPIYLARHRPPKTPEQLEAHEWVVFASTRRVQLKGEHGAVAIATNGRVVCDDMVFLLHALRRGMGVGILPRFLAESDLRAGQLVSLLPSWEVTGAKLWLVTHAGRKTSRSLAALLDCIEATFAAHGLTEPR